jgi:hypothetical protein
VNDPVLPGEPITGTIDRARGLSVGNTTIYQAIPTGFALNIDISGMGVRCIHLRRKAVNTAVAELNDPAGAPLQFLLESDRPLDYTKDPGLLTAYVVRQGQSLKLQPGDRFPFGPAAARFLAVSQWGAFTYTRSPGIGLVFSGFAIALAGCFLLLFPVGVARIEDQSGNSHVNVYLSRGIELLLMDWQKYLTPLNESKTTGDP